MNYIKSMPSEFEKMEDSNNMWSVVIVYDLFYEFCEVAKDESISQVWCTAELLIIALDDGEDARRQRLTSET